MHREYDIFEKFADGSIVWIEFVEGLENATARLQLLGSRSPNEHFAMYAPTKEIVARVNERN